MKLKLFKPVKKTGVEEEGVDKIKDMIEKGRLQSGEKLPGERELAEVFRVSRSSVREALRYLESQGFLESRQGEGWTDGTVRDAPAVRTPSRLPGRGAGHRGRNRHDGAGPVPSGGGDRQRGNRHRCR